MANSFETPKPQFPSLHRKGEMANSFETPKPQFPSLHRKGERGTAFRTISIAAHKKTTSECPWFEKEKQKTTDRVQPVV